MKALTVLTLTAALLASAGAFASAEMAASHKCNTCHAMDKKMMGPSWKDIAAKNKGQKDAEKMLAEAIVKGSKNKYGKVPMPPQPKAQADAAALAKWVLSL